MFLILIGVIYVICNATAWFLIPTSVLMIILYFVRHFYLPSSRSIKRLEGISKYATNCNSVLYTEKICVKLGILARSPVVGHLKASLEGLPTIRANKAQSILQYEFDKHLDVFNSVYYMFMTTSRFFGFFMDFLCMIYTAIITVTFLTINTGED